MTDLVSSIFPELSGSKKKVHLIGIGGIGMSALARWFLAQRANPEQGRRVGSSKGWSSKIAIKRLVSGSDLAQSVITRGLAKEGLEVKIGHKEGHISPRIGLVVYSQAVKSSNPELRKAKRLGIPLLSYAEAVGRLTRHYKTIAVAGTHGKSTTTAMISLIMVKASLDPTVIVGTNLREFGNKNFRASHSHRHGHSHSNYLVLEADEFGKSFLHYSPILTVVTNIDLDHLDTYKNLRDIQNNFLKFLANTKEGGMLVLNRNSRPLFTLKTQIKKIAKKRKLKISWYSAGRPIAAKVKRVIKIQGTHNLSNAVTAYEVVRNLGVSGKEILSALSQYRGSWRRMEYKGECQVSPNSRAKLATGQAGVRCQVYDDYAHHPTEIRATLKAFREKYPRSPIVCVYQPHQVLRLKKLWKDFLTAFGDADILILLPTYQVAGRERVEGPTVAKALAGRQGSRVKRSSKKLAVTIKKKYPKKHVFYLANPKNIKRFLSKILNSRFYILDSGVIVMMGAGDIVNYTELLLGKER